MLDFNQISWQEYLDTCSFLWEEHFAEASTDGLHDYLDINSAKYEELEKANLLRILTLKENNSIIGYYVVIIGTPLHYKHIKAAQVDTYYVKPCKTRAFLYIKLFNEMEKRLKEEGVNKIFSHENVHLTSLFPIFCRLGYRPTQVIYCKAL